MLIVWRSAASAATQLQANDHTWKLTTNIRQSNDDYNAAMFLATLQEN